MESHKLCHALILLLLYRVYVAHSFADLILGTLQLLSDFTTQTIIIISKSIIQLQLLLFAFQ